MTHSLAPSPKRVEELEQQLQQRTSELVEARKDLENLTYSVSHDLKAPLRHILGYNQIIVEDFRAGMDPQCAKYLEHIGEDARRMAGMVDDLLRLSRLGSQRLCRQPVALQHLVQDVIHEISRGSDSRQIEWKAGDLPEVECDAAMVREVFTQLLGNALKFTRMVEHAVIETGTVEQAGTLTFFVRDNGVGFDMKYADRLFSIFQRLHPPQDFDGRGAGLAMAQRIVRLHGGRAWAEATPNKGATFYFTLGSTSGPVR